MNVPRQNPPIDFLPKVEVTTVVWADALDEELPAKWWAAQGDDLKRKRPTIEIYFPRVLQEAEDVAGALIRVWLEMYIVLATRQALIDRGVRWAVSGDGHETLYKGNFKAIEASPLLWAAYTKIAVGELIMGKHVTTPERPDLAQSLKSVMQDMDAQVALMEADQVIRTAKAQAWFRRGKGEGHD